MLKYYNLSYPLVGSSNSHPKGDRAKSNTGIV
jgi:hypothetical protein